MSIRLLAGVFALVLLCERAPAQFSPAQLDRWLERFPQADADGDGTLTIEEAASYRNKMQRGRDGDRAGNGGTPREFAVDPGWEAGKFPPNAVAYKSPAEIAAIFAKTQEGNRSPVVSYPMPRDPSLRIVGTGHSFMAPGYKTFPLIARAAGLSQPDLLTHTGGGITGSARYKWEQENGIFQFDGRPVPKLK